MFKTNYFKVYAFANNIGHYNTVIEFGCESIGVALYIVVHQMGLISEIYAR